MGKYWSDAELIVAVYFTSRGFTEAAVSQILHARGFRRSYDAVYRKIKDIRNKHPVLQAKDQDWDINAVDLWLDELSLDHQTVNHLICCSDLEATIAAKHGVAESILEKLERSNWRWMA
ncbi:uncharacterized protein ATNIH1004_001869 [Aspergillus tanneri]|uniref:Uncharacterized protein n=1 Tax=Aspergillus tanneri TaxID=1220188 RepID=A0A5M9M7U0_9EURO|nr:uncharacterized protein ATNIH1004_001869 [Aspergillus tanneri]KAA8641404.1 hypothetical protein ATNIH1004_001869 [Aspergillus tanneri]